MTAPALGSDETRKNKNETLIKLEGTWTNITVADIFGPDEAISLCQTQCVRFIQNQNYPAVKPQIYGVDG